MNPCKSYFKANQGFMSEMSDIFMCFIIKYMINLGVYIIYLIIEDYMRRLDLDTIKQTYKRLEKGKVFTIDQLVSALKCSTPNARLKLKQWRAFRSFNKNGRFYTLPHVPRFDRYGLWRYKDVAFSRHGNLKKTIIHLVNSSVSGITGKELGDLLGLLPQSFVHHFRDCPDICRDKHRGVYVYFSDHPDVYKQQVQRRSLTPVARASLSDADAVMILVAVIKHHGISMKDILTLPEIKKKRVSETALHDFLQAHGLLKKMPATGP